jgi:hypothetical protein
MASPGTLRSVRTALSDAGLPIRAHRRFFARARLVGYAALPRMVKVCSVIGCARPVLARGFCAKYRRRWKTHGDPRVTLIDRDHAVGCAVAGCECPYYARGLCKRHYERAKSAPAVRHAPGKRCRMEGRARPHYARGLWSVVQGVSTAVSPSGLASQILMSFRQSAEAR